MFNLPWYSWFNVLAMPCLWAMLSLNSALASQPVWHRKVLKLQIIAAVVTIFLYWNPLVSELLTPLHFVLVLLVLPLLLWNVGAALIEITEISWLKLSASARQPELARVDHRSVNPESEIRSDVLSANDVDLDGGESPLQREREVGEAISTLFSNRCSATGMAGSLGKLFGQPDDQDLIDSAGIYITGMLIYGLVVSSVLMPAAYMSLRMAGLFQ